MNKGFLSTKFNVCTVNIFVIGVNKNVNGCSQRGSDR